MTENIYTFRLRLISDKCLDLRFSDHRAITNYARQDFSSAGTIDDWTVAFWFKIDDPKRQINAGEAMFSFATNGTRYANDIYIGLRNKYHGDDEFQLECIFNDITPGTFLSGNYIMTLELRNRSNQEILAPEWLITSHVT